MKIPSSRFDFILILIVGLAITIYLLQLTPDQGWHDFALYAMQAKSILTNQVDELFQMNKYSVEHSSAPNGPYLYPWGFPLLLAPLLYFFGFKLCVFKVYIVLFFGACLYSIYILFKDRLGKKMGILMVCVFGFNPLFVLHTNNVLSDIPFLFFSLITLYFIQKIVINRSQLYGKIADKLLLGIFIFICYAIRSNGIVFLPVLILSQAFVALKNEKEAKRKFQIENFKFLQILPYLVFILLNLLLNSLLPEGSSSHFDLLSKVSTESLFGNLIYYLKLPSHFYYLDSLRVLYFLTLPVTILGIFKNWQKDFLFILFILFSAGILVVWPYTQGMRFIFPLLPFYLYFTFSGFQNIQVYLSKNATPKKIMLNQAFAAFMITIFLFIQVKAIANGEKIILPGPYDDESQEMFQFINSNLLNNDTIIFRKPRSMMLFTGKFSLRENRPDSVIKYQAGYLVIDKTETDHQIDLEKLPKAYASSLKSVFQNERFIIYKVVSRSSKDSLPKKVQYAPESFPPQHPNYIFLKRF